MVTGEKLIWEIIYNLANFQQNRFQKIVADGH